MTDKTKSHPDYEIGYSDALNGRPHDDNSSAPYNAGWVAGTFTREAFLRAGLTPDDGGNRFTFKGTVR